ncbi:MAG: hypothetical protein KIS96_10700 [Bauldia sp.]|nr:hypothetical protein [Bauldia sp.]
MTAFTNGLSPAGRRLRAAGLAFERQQRAAPPLPQSSAETRGEDPDAALAAKIADALASHGRPDDEPLPLGLIIAATAAAFGFHPRMLRGSARRRDYVVPRHVAALLCHELTGTSFAAIGRALGSRDHSTIAAAIRVARERIAADPALAATVAALRDRLEGDAP